MAEEEGTHRSILGTILEEKINNKTKKYDPALPIRTKPVLRGEMQLVSAFLLAVTTTGRLAPGPPPPFVKGPCEYSDTAGAPWCDVTKTAEARAALLVANLSVAEKATQFRNGQGPITRLHIMAYSYWSEALHGVADDGVRLPQKPRSAHRTAPPLSPPPPLFSPRVCLPPTVPTPSLRSFPRTFAPAEHSPCELIADPASPSHPGPSPLPCAMRHCAMKYKNNINNNNRSPHHSRR